MSAWPMILDEIAGCLSEAYDSYKDADYICARVKLNRSNIIIRGVGWYNLWQGIAMYAYEHGKLKELLKTAQKDNPNDRAIAEIIHTLQSETMR